MFKKDTQEINFWQVLESLFSVKVQDWGAVVNRVRKFVCPFYPSNAVSFFLDKTREKFSEDYCMQNR